MLDKMANQIIKIKRSELDIVGNIGEGAFSSVYHVIWTSPTGPSIHVAAKKLVKKDVHEPDVLSRLDHPNIVILKGVVDEGMDYFLILELCEGGSLRSYLDKGNLLTSEQLYDWIKQAALPLEYLKQKNIIHKDVKSLNYLITSAKTLKLGDFGLAKNLGLTMSKATGRGSVPWMAPELLKSRQILSPKYDIFALGVVIWEMVTGRVPHEGLAYFQIIYYVGDLDEDKDLLDIPTDCPEAIKTLMKWCWKINWNERPSAEEVISSITEAASAAKASEGADTTVAEVKTSGPAPEQTPREAVGLGVKTGQSTMQPGDPLSDVPLQITEAASVAKASEEADITVAEVEIQEPAPDQTPRGAVGVGVEMGMSTTQLGDLWSDGPLQITEAASAANTTEGADITVAEVKTPEPAPDQTPREALRAGVETGMSTMQFEDRWTHVPLQGYPHNSSQFTPTFPAAMNDPFSSRLGASNFRRELTFPAASLAIQPAQQSLQYQTTPYYRQVQQQPPVFDAPVALRPTPPGYGYFPTNYEYARGFPAVHPGTMPLHLRYPPTMASSPRGTMPPHDPNLQYPPTMTSTPCGTMPPHPHYPPITVSTPLMPPHDRHVQYFPPTMASIPPAISMVSTSAMSILNGDWKLEKKFGHQGGPGKLECAWGIAVHPNGSIAIADYKASQVKVYSIHGKYQVSLHTTHGLKPGGTSQPRQVTINSHGVYFVTDYTNQVKTYGADGRYIDHWQSPGSQVSPDTSNLMGLAMDSEENLLVGDTSSNHVHKHRQDGTYLGSIKVNINPLYIAVTSQGTIVISGDGVSPQIVSNTGQVIHTLKHHVDESRWNPWGVYCYKDIILFANWKINNILCYSESGQYLGDVPIPGISDPTGIALTANGRKLFVCEEQAVKSFSL